MLSEVWEDFWMIQDYFDKTQDYLSIDNELKNLKLLLNVNILSKLSKFENKRVIQP